MSGKQLTLEEFNHLDNVQFTELFPNLLDNCGIMASEMSTKTYHNIMDIYSVFCNLMDRMDSSRKKGILQGHPGLGAKLAELVGLSEIQKRRLIRYMEKYKHKFGFAFVICHKEYKIEEIIVALKRRITQHPDNEMEESIVELTKITKYHILSLIKHEYA